MESTHKGHLPIPKLVPAATKAHFFQHLRLPLLSLGQLCDDGCEVWLRENDVMVFKNNTLAMWEVIISPNAKNRMAANNIYQIRKSKDVINFHHKSCFPPTKNTWLPAILNGHSAGWPGLTAERARRYFNKSDATIKGHMKQTWQGVRSTQAASAFATSLASIPSVPNQDAGNKTSYHFVSMVQADPLKHTSYSDLTGQFLTTSSKGSKYFLCFTIMTLT